LLSVTALALTRREHGDEFGKLATKCFLLLAHRARVVHDEEEIDLVDVAGVQVLAGTPTSTATASAKLLARPIPRATRSNATVGPPIEVLVYEADQLRTDRRFVFTAEDPYLSDLKLAWDTKLKEAFTELRRYSWQPGGRSDQQVPPQGVVPENSGNSN